MADLEMLLKIRAFLEKKYPDFPKFRCGEAASLVKKALHYSFRAGYFYVPSKQVKNGHILETLETAFIPHAWNYNSRDKELVDVCADQFGVNNKILVLPSGSDLARRYLFSLGKFFLFECEQLRNWSYGDDYAEFNKLINIPVINA